MKTESTPTILKEKEIRSSIISLRNDGIMQFAFKPEYIVNLEDLKEMVVTNGELGGKKKYPILVIGTKNSSMTAEAKYFSATPEANIYVSACAIVVSSLAQRLIANTYLQFSSPIVPSKVFETEDKAIAWLKQL